MKRILLLAFAILSINSVFAQSQKNVFVEEFTQASCPPCEASTPMLNTILNANADKVVQLRYQTSWPGVDPMNADNPTEVADRVSYYGVTGVPNLLLDGAEPSGPVFPELLIQSNIDASYAVDAPVVMTVTHTIAEDLATASVTVEITNEGTEAYSLVTNRLRVALVEEEITFDTPPGSTSITVFDAVMKTFLTTTAGMELPEIAAGETWTNTWTDVEIPARIYDYRQLGVVAFLQNDANRNVLQSGHSEPLELTGYPNIRPTSTASIDGDLCDYAFTGSVMVTNNGDAEATGYTVNYVLNGAVEAAMTIDEPLAAGESTEITFEEVTLPAGTSVFGFVLTTDQADLSTTNKATNAIFIGKAGAVSENIDRDYENETADPFAAAAGTIVDVPFNTLNFTVVSQAVLGGNTALGGFGESTNSISVNFFSWNPANINATGSMIIADQYVVPAEGVELSFDYAYTSWGGSNDRLVAEVSTDCGSTFTEVFNQSGSQLATAPELNANDARFLPSATQWRTIEADLSDYAGETILVRFRVVSAWGDMLYIDNIALRVITDINELNADESLNVYPNPASSLVNVELTTNNASQVQLRVIDMIGRTVKTENLGTVAGRINHTLDVSAMENGSYLILMNVDGRDVVKRLSVAH